MLYIEQSQTPLYLTAEEYKELANKIGYDVSIPDEEIQIELRKSQEKIDILTFNRIKKAGFEKLTPYQKGTIQSCLFDFANFQYENSELLESIISSYSLNGVSLTIENSQKITNINGVLVKNEIYEKLKSTGLCNLNI